MTEYAKDRIYPNSVSEFRHLQKQDGTLELQVRYINESQGYTGKWQAIKVEYEQKPINAEA
jgi:hypothetical protein